MLCTGQNIQAQKTDLLLFNDDAKNLDEYGNVNPDQLENVSFMEIPSAKIIDIYKSEKNEIIILFTHPNYFLVQYQLNPSV